MLYSGKLLIFHGEYQFLQFIKGSNSKIYLIGIVFNQDLNLDLQPNRLESV